MIKLTNCYIFPKIVVIPNFVGFVNSVGKVVGFENDEIVVEWRYILETNTTDYTLYISKMKDNLHAGDQIADDVAIQDITPNSHATLFDGRELKLGTIFCLYSPDGKDGRG